MRRSLVLLALLVPTAPFARAAVVGPVELYPVAPQAWSAAIGGALARPAAASSLSPSLAALSAPDLQAAYAPVVAHLQTSLGLAPETFAALPPAEQSAALELAVDDAKTDLQKTAYALEARSSALSAPERELDKDGRAELFGVVSRLHEMRTRYGPLLGERERETVEASYGRAMTRAIAVRNKMLGRAQQMGAALAGAGRDAPVPVPAPAAFTPETLPGARSAAVKLYERMSATSAGWGIDDVDALLTGYGFARRDGKHRNYTHPLFPQLTDSFSHQKKLKDVYAKAAVRLVRELARLSSPASSASAAPELVSLEDLALLLAERKPAAPAERTEPEDAPSPTPARRAWRLAPAPASPAPHAAPKTAPPAPAASPAPSTNPVARRNWWWWDRMTAWFRRGR